MAKKAPKSDTPDISPKNDQITLTARKSKQVLGALSRLSENDMPIAMAVRIGRNITAIREYVDPLDKKTNAIFKEHADREGKIIPNSPAHLKYVEKADKLLDEVYPIEVHTVTISELEGVEVKVSPMVAAELMESGILLED